MCIDYGNMIPIMLFPCRLTHSRSSNPNWIGEEKRLCSNRATDGKRCVRIEEQALSQDDFAITNPRPPPTTLSSNGQFWFSLQHRDVEVGALEWLIMPHSGSRLEEYKLEHPTM